MNSLQILVIFVGTRYAWLLRCTVGAIHVVFLAISAQVAQQVTVGTQLQNRFAHPCKQTQITPS